MINYLTTTSLSFHAVRGMLYLFVLMICLLVLIIPSIQMEELQHPAQTGKFVFFLGAMLVIVGMMVVWLTVKDRLMVGIHLFDIALSVLLAYVTVNRFWIQPYYGFSMKYDELLGLSVLYVVLRNVPKSAFIYLLLAVMGGGILQAVYGAFQLWGYAPMAHSGFRIAGSFLNPGPYSGFLAAVFPIALGVYLFRNQIMEQPAFHAIGAPHFLLRLLFEYLPLTGILSIVLVLPASQSRAAWLSVILSSALLLNQRYHLLSLARRVLNKTWKKSLVGLLLLLSAGAGGYGVYHFKQGSADGRLLIWKVTSSLIADHPWTGVGYDQFKAYYMFYQAAYFKAHGDGVEAWVAGDNYYAFNELFGFIAEQGFIGTGLLAGLVALILKQAMTPTLGYASIIALSGLLSIVTFGMFSYPGEILPVKICMVLYLAVLVAEKRPMRQISLDLRPSLKCALALGIMCLLGLTAQAGVRFKQAHQDWQDAVHSYKAGLYAESVEKYEKLYPFLKFNGEYLMNYGKALSMAENDEKAVRVLEDARNYYSSAIIETASGDSYKRLKRYDKAAADYRNADDMVPSRLYPKYLLAKLYLESGDEAAAFDEAKKILRMDVKIHSRATEEIKLEMRNIMVAHKELKSDLNK
jgi:hypothetical protein